MIRHPLIYSLIIAGICIYIYASIKEAEAGFEDQFNDNTTIIGCIHKQTLETRYPNNRGDCLYGNGWQNIAIPPKSHIEIWKEVFGDDRAIINRLAIINFESGFREDVGNKYAHGYVQTLRSYKIAPDVRSQLEWMRDRQESQKNGNCSQWETEDRMVRCLYNRHYGMRTAYNWYDNKAMKAREFYINYFSKNENY